MIMPELIVDLHVHSHYSRATSRDCTLEGLQRWGKIKGINIIGTGDFTHPQWLDELRNKLIPAEPGLYRLRDDLAAAIDAELPPAVREQLIRFVPSVEIATIYTKGGRVRKLHQLLVAPSLEVAEAINARLERIGNLNADGRPILGLDAKELLRIALQVDPRVLYIPAHIWTPWFGMFGSKSGFDSIQEAYEELAPHIHAIETGLSSDPAMNWRIANLDGIAITSHSDAHSPSKLGREATVVAAELAYDDIIGAIKANDRRLIGTIEFFPQEGKYHHDGHRTCNVRLTPQETKALGGICPVCHKPLTIGVHYRVDELATRPTDFVSSLQKHVQYIIPLAEIIAELKGMKTTASKAVQTDYFRAIEQLGHEFAILRTVPIDTIHDAGFVELARAIDKLRRGDVSIDPGYDGIFGTIQLSKLPDDSI